MIYIEKIKDNELLKYIPGTHREELVIPDGIEIIGTGICNPEPECNDLEDDSFILSNWDLFPVKRIIIPASVKEIKPAAFWNIPQLEEIVIDDTSSAAKVVDGVLFSTDGKRLICCPSARKGEYKVPAGVEIIGENGFDSSNLEKVILPDGLTDIEDDAFCCSFYLKEVYIPASVQTFGERIFQYCDKDEITVKAPKGSYAIEYAKRQGVKHIEA